MKYTIKDWLRKDCLHGWKWEVGTFCENCGNSVRLIVWHPQARKESTEQRLKRWMKYQKKEWLKRYKNRMIEHGVSEEEAQAAADAADTNKFYGEGDPEDAADDELSYWASDG